MRSSHAISASCRLPGAHLEYAPMLTLLCEYVPRPLRQQAAGEGASAELPDAVLVTAVREGLPHAYDRIVERYAPRLYRHLARMLGNREEAEDLVQETFIKAYRALGRFDVKQDFRAWLYTIANNAARNALRARSRRIQFLAMPEEQGPCSASDTVEARARLEAEERQAQVERLLLRLPPMSRALLDLYYREGMSLREAAAITGTSEGAAKVALHRARQQLRILWEAEDRS